METQQKATLLLKNVKPGYYIWGKKGDVWQNTVHLSKNSETLCGLPMLGNNWGRIEKIQEIGCPKCIEIYQRETKEKE